MAKHIAVVGDERQTMAKFIALIQAGFVRDAQVFVGNPSAPNIAYSDDWADVKSPELFVGVFDGANEEEVLTRAAASTGCHKNCLRLVPVDTITAEEVRRA